MSQDFITAYIACALWSSTDNSRENGGDPLDDNYSVEDVDEETVALMRKDCETFLRLAGEAIERATHKTAHKHGGKYDMAGHDFWLNRNRHGCGFWDGDWDEPWATTLDALAESFGEFDLYVGDDGKVYGHKS